jgi:hypothetical protein
MNTQQRIGRTTHKRAALRDGVAADAIEADAGGQHRQAA